MKCFKCRNNFPNAEELNVHLKNDHGLCGKNEFDCLQCGTTFEKLSDFQKHLETCKRISEYPQTKPDGQFFFLNNKSKLNYSRGVKTISPKL